MRKQDFPKELFIEKNKENDSETPQLLDVLGQEERQQKKIMMKDNKRNHVCFFFFTLAMSLYPQPVTTWNFT